MKTGVHSIIQKINADAEQHGSERYTQIKNEIDDVIHKENTFYREELDKRREILKNHNEHEYERLLERLSSRLNRELLTYQSELLDEIFDMAVCKLRDASEKEFYDMFKSAVNGLKGRFTLYLGEFSKGKLDNSKVTEMIKENQGLEIIASTDTIPQKSGFILVDDRVELNSLFEDIIEDKKNEQAAAILKEVFLDG